MDYYYYTILGVAQGITELLPISSSGHMIIISELFRREPTLFLLTALHLASALALLLLYWDKIMEIVRSENRRQYLCKIVIASIPVVITGVVLGDLLETTFYNYRFISYNLIFWGVIMIITEFFEKKLERKQDEEINMQNAIVMGVFQSLSLIPGTSRSGISTMAGIWSGAKKDKALDFSFIVGIPLLFGAFFYDILKSGSGADREIDLNFIMAFILSFIFSYLAAYLLRKFNKKKFLTVLGVYRIVLGIVLLIIFTNYL